MAEASIQIGKLRDKVRLERPLTAADQFGQSMERFVGVAIVWARIRRMRGRELAEAQSTVRRGDTKIHVRWGDWRDGDTNPDGHELDETWRVVLPEGDDATGAGGRVFEIVSVVDVNERHRFAEIVAVELVRERATASPEATAGGGATWDDPSGDAGGA